MTAVASLPDMAMHLQRHFPTALESIVFTPLPFFKDLLLVILFPETSIKPVQVLAELMLDLPETISPLCINGNELYRLSLPSPYALETFSMPFWIRGAGKILWGSDIRPRVPLCRLFPRFLGYHLEVATHQLRNHVVLRSLTRREYLPLYTGLKRQMALIMVTALLSKGIWEVYPNTLVGRFCEAYSSPIFLEIMTSFDHLQKELSAEPIQIQKAVALRAVWLFESFLRGLWRCEDERRV